MPKQFTQFFRVAFLFAFFASFVPSQSVYAAAILSVTPITWNVMGLDSNNVNVGPNHFPIGARVCNTGDAIANNVKSAFTWVTTDTYINTRPGTLSAYTANGVNLNPGECTDFYYEVEITRNALAYDHTARYTITASADGGISGSTPTPREVFVEHLVSQNRNSVTDVQLDGVSIAPGGTMSLMVGQTYTIKLVGATATQGYEQIESFINFPNTIFQVLSAVTTYSAETSATMTPPYDKLYGDACVWDNDPNSPNYRDCTSLLSGQKAGGNVTVTYQVKILQVPGAPLVNPEPLSTLIYDFSGSSFHYNADFGISTRFAYIVDPASAVTIAKNFSPDPTNAGGVSALTFTLTNPTSVTISGLNFTDTLPTTPGAMTVAPTPGTTTTGCGSPTFAPLAGAASVSFSNGTLAPNSSCTIKVNVTVPVAGTYNNTSTNLFINSVDTGKFATDSLTVNNAPAAPACVSGLAMARWTFPTGFNVASPAASTSTVTASASPGAGLSVPTVSNAATHTAGTRSWSSNGGIATGAVLNTANNDYFQFAIDTTGYSEVYLDFWARRTNNGPQGIAVYYGTSATPPGTSAFNNATGIPAASTWTHFGDGTTTIAFTSGLNASGLTYFRIYGFNASNSVPGSDMLIDDVTFTGCGIPNPPTVTKAFAPNPVVVGGASTLTFTLTNPNASVALSGITFSDVLPAGVTVTSAGPTAVCGGTVTRTAPSTISFAGGTLAASANCTIAVPVTATTAGPHDNVSGFISSTQSGINTTSSGYATASLTALLPPSIAKAFAANPILAGGTSILMFTITNPNQNDTLAGLTFTDTFPVAPGAMTVAAPLATTNTCGGTLQDSGGGVLAAADPGIRLNAGTLAGGSTCTVTVRVIAPTAGGYANTSGAVSSTNGGTGNTASRTLTVTAPNPAIALLKQVSTSPTGPWTSFVSVATADNVYYQFTIENTGDVVLSPVSVTDALVSTASCTWPASLPAAVAANNNHIATCVVGPVTALVGSHTNTATASGTFGGTAYTSTSSSAIYATIGLTLAKSVTETSFTVANDLLHYSYLVTNSGFAPLLGPVTVSDDKITLPGTVTCPAVNTAGDLDDWLDAGESLTCTATYTVVAADVTAGFVTNTASATVSGVTSNTDSKTIPILRPDLTVTKSNNVSGSVAQNDTFDWTINVSNSGTSTAAFADTNVIMNDTLPGVAGYYPQGVLAVVNGGTPPTGAIDCSITGTALSCVANGAVTLPVGASFSVIFAVTPTAGGALANTATVDSNGNVAESNEANNTGSNTVSIIVPPVVSKAFGTSPIIVGNSTSITFTITNPATNTITLTGVNFTDTYPAGIENAAVPNASTTCTGGTLTAAANGGSVSLSGASLAPNTSCTVSVTITGTASGTSTNIVTVSSTESGNSNTASATLIQGDKNNVCAIPGKDGPAATLAGVLNTYYPGTANAAAGATSIPVGAARVGGGPAIAAGDLLLVVQMQGADIDGSNTNNYGNGIGNNGTTVNTVPYPVGDPNYAGGNVAANFSAGQYEYVVATGPVAGGFVPISTGLVNNYFNANYATQGQRRYQVIRVPQYSDATLGGVVTALAWNGSTGGLVVFDVTGQLDWNGNTIDVNGLGFRGGGGRQLPGGAGNWWDYRTLAGTNANGQKGEGYAGTPQYVNDNGALLNTGVEGYLNGSSGRGGAGNGGGGSTDGNPAANNQNSGGGGGGNGGYGGMGGNAWNSVLVDGGYGGAPFPGAAPRLIMGGGGGAGTSNNGTGTPAAGFASSGAAGGGVVFIRAGTITGAGTINANGATANQSVLNDGGGGGGAGGSVVVISRNGAGNVGTLTVNAVGGNGGVAWPAQAGNASRHGPGGGGGGGFVFTSGGVTVASSVAGGVNGTTTNPGQAFGATPGGTGILVTNVSAANAPLSISGANCVPAALTVTKTTSTPVVTQTAAGTTGTYTITASLPASSAGVSGVTISDVLPAGFTYASTTSTVLSGNAVQTSVSNPTVGSAAPNWGVFDILSGDSVTITFDVDIDSTVALGTYQNPASAAYLDPVRTIPTTTLISSYDPASSTGEDITVLGPPSISKSFGATSINVGGNTTLSFTVTNPNSTNLTGIAFTDVLPAGLTAPNGTTNNVCGGSGTSVISGGNTITVTGITINGAVGGASCTFNVTVTGATSGVKNNTTGAISSTETGVGTTSNTASLTVLAAPTITKAFAVASLESGGNTDLTVTIGNTNTTAITLTSLLTDTFPAGITINTAGNTGTCTGVTATAGAGNFTIANGTSIPAGGCTVIVNVTSSTAGAATNTIAAGALQTSAGNNVAAANATLNVFVPPTVTKTFGAASIAAGGSTTLTLTLGNPAGNPGALTTVQVDDTFPVGLTLQDIAFTFTPAACGTVTKISGAASAAGDDNVRFNAATIAAGSTCRVDVNVTSSTSGTITNTTLAPTSANGGTGVAANASLNVVTIDAVNDTGSTINGATGGTAVANVLVNDTLNGVAATTANVNITLVGALPAGLTFNTATGAVTVAPGTAAGSYTFDYQICDKLNPTICDTATVTVPVVTIDAVNDTGSTINGATGGTAVANVLVNDTLNGVAATTANVNITLVGALPAGLTFNTATGAVTVAPGTAAGSYTFDYQICDKLNPTICDTATVTVPVVTIDAVNDTGSTINGATGGTSIANVLVNDTLNGVAATTANVDITLVAALPAGITFNTATGAVTVAPGTAAGSYTFDYQICDKLNPAICDTATVTVPVVTIAAVNDTGSSVDGTAGGTSIANVLVNDTLNGVAATIANVDITLVGALPAGITFNTATGAVAVAPGTAAGSYTFDYQICDKLNPTICDIATVTVPVVTIDAVNDTGNTINGAVGGTAVANVLTNDTLNGVAATIANVDITLVGALPAGITFNTATGAVTVAPGTAAGSYTFDYQICDKLNPAICDTATVTVPVVTINAVNDTGSSLDGVIGGTAIANVLVNDTLNGVAATTANVDITLVGALPAGLTFNTATGAVTVAPGTAGGSYTFDYQICDKLNPTICDTATVTVPVLGVNATNDTGVILDGAVGGTAVANVLTNDTLNGVAATTANVDITLVGALPVGLTFNTATGAVTVAPGTAAGSYTFDYQICDKLNPAICDTATVTVPVGTINAVNDAGNNINGVVGGTAVANVLTNDTLNGVAATIATVDITLVGPLPAGLTFNTATGAVTVAPGTAAGSYTFDYQICDKLNPAICDTATVTVPVLAVDAVNDTGSPINGATGGTAIPNVLTNDTLNGVPATTANVNITLVGALPAGLTFNTATGAVTVAPGTAAGSYTFDYQICDKLNPTICDTATVAVNVISTGIAKIITGTSEADTLLNDVAIGEIVTYEITIDLPAGLAFNNVVVTDRMDKGLAFVDCLSVVLAGTNVTGTVCPPTVSSITNPGDLGTNPANPGRQVQFTVGNIPAPAAASTLVIQYRAIVLDVIENQEGIKSNNNVTWSWNGGSLSTSAPDVTIVEPDMNIDKSAIPANNVAVGAPIQFTLTIAHTAQSSEDAFDVVVTDILPAGLEYIPCTVTYAGLAPTTPPAAPAPYCPAAATNLTFVWDTFPLGQSATITFNARLDGTRPSVTNTSSLAWTSLLIDPAGIPPLPVQLSTHNATSTERAYDPGDPVDVYQVTSSVRINPPAVVPPADVDLPDVLPATGFAPNVITALPDQSVEKLYTATDVWVEVPSLGVNIPIVGVPLVDGDWDVSWLEKQAGWLNGTAFPGWEGNSALTGHVYLPNGKPGPFVELGKLKWGDKIIVHAYGSVYTYEVRENRTVSPTNTSVLKHEDDSWLTLITCKTYNEATNRYANRIAVRATLVSVQIDKLDGIPKSGR